VGTSSRRRFILAPYGSAGDVYPFLWLGKALQKRGHRVIILTSPVFLRAARQAGIRLLPVGTEEQYHSMVDDPMLWDPWIGSWKVMSAVKDWFPRISGTLERMARPENSVLLASGPNFPAWLAARKLGRPLITVHLQPLMLFSLEKTPILMSGLAWVSRMPRWFKRLVLGLPSPADLLLRSTIADACRSARLPLPKRLLMDWWNSPDGVLCLFPEWFAAPQSDWPHPLLQTEFPLFDLPGDKETEEPLLDFLNGGKPPVVFTAGSAMRCGERFFQAAVGASRKLGCRAVLIAPYQEQIPPDLPEGVAHFSYAAFSTLFARVRAVVHHGGIGTTARAFAAGVPQIIVPMSHDQPDNGQRVCHLGVGSVIRSQDLTADNLAAKLGKILKSESFRERAEKIQGRMSLSPDGCEAAEWIEKIVGDSRNFSSARPIISLPQPFSPS